jgi:uncharacterized protein YbjT (DUF2867 family)
LGAALLEAGWAVRGTSRGKEGMEAIRAAGIEAAQADPALPGTILELVGDVAVVHWLLGSAAGGGEEVAAIHGPKLVAILERFVDTPVRGFVYEAAGSVEDGDFDAGRAAVENAAATWKIPIGMIEVDPGDHDAWLAAAVKNTRDLVSEAGEVI